VKHALVSVLAACSIPDVNLAGKPCPCATRYVCDSATSTCVTSLGGSDAARGGSDAGTDSSVAASCLAAPLTTPLYSTTFPDLSGWAIGGGTWAATDNQAVQSDAGNGLAYAYHPSSTQLTDQRVVSHFQMISGGDGRALELAVRVQGGVSAGQYHCNWEPTDGAFLIMYTQTATMTGQLAMTNIDLRLIPSYSPFDPVTMELQVRGSRLDCCLREIPAASLTAMDTQFTSGSPGMKTYEESGSYDYVDVYGP